LGKYWKRNTEWHIFNQAQHPFALIYCSPVSTNSSTCQLFSFSAHFNLKLSLLFKLFTNCSITYVHKYWSTILSIVTQSFVQVSGNCIHKCISKSSYFYLSNLIQVNFKMWNVILRLFWNELSKKKMDFLINVLTRHYSIFKTCKCLCLHICKWSRHISAI
jgi:hypothetical protein